MVWLERIFKSTFTRLHGAEMAVYGYCRVSTDRQANEGESLDVQRRKLEGYAMQQGWSLTETFVERGVSGSKPLDERQEGQRLLTVIKPGDVIITAKLDRMFRSALDALRVLSDLQKVPVSLHMIDLGGDVTGNGVSKLVFTILSAVAEAERERIRERVRETKADQRNRGRFLGGRDPFGWRKVDDKDGIALVPDPDQQQAIKDMVAMRLSGRTLRDIAEKMRGRGYSISHMAVKNIVAREHP